MMKFGDSCKGPPTGGAIDNAISGWANQVFALYSQHANARHRLGLSNSRGDGLVQRCSISVDVKSRLPANCCNCGVAEPRIKERVARCLVDRPIEDQNERVSRHRSSIQKLGAPVGPTVPTGPAYRKELQLIAVTTGPYRPPVCHSEVATSERFGRIGWVAQ